MGHVFPLEDVLEGRVPRLEDYPTALNIAESHLQQFFEEGKIRGALIFGSIKNSYSVGSDTDILVVYEDETGLSALRGLRCDIQEKTFVPIEFIPVKAELGSNGIHNINSAFRQHLEYHTGFGCIGKNPLDFISRRAAPYRQDLIDTLAVYSHGLDKMFVNEDFGDPKYYLFLQYILEKPIHAVRVMLQSIYGNLPTDEQGRSVDDKQGLYKIYREQFFGHLPLLEDLMKIFEAQKNYRKFLQNLPAENLETAYIAELRKIEDVYQNSSRFIRENALLL